MKNTGGLIIAHINEKVEYNPKKVVELYNAGTPMFVKFYADWCGHCVELAPIWDKLERILKKKYNKTNMALVSMEESSIKKMVDSKDADADAFKEQLKKIVNGFPTLGFFKNKQFTVFQGERTIKGMMSFIKSNLKTQGGGGKSKSKRKSTRKSTKKVKRTNRAKKSLRKTKSRRNF
jgi:thiol-disulfide isomerase/thioredoxin